MRRRFVQHNKRHAGRKSKPRKTYFYSRKHDDATSLPKNEVARGKDVPSCVWPGLHACSIPPYKKTSCIIGIFLTAISTHDAQ